MSVSSAATTRYIRQQGHFSDQARRESALVELAGQASPMLSRFAKAGAAAAGVPLVASDYHALPFSPFGQTDAADRHWLLGDHQRLVKTLNPEVRYEYVDPELVDEQLREFAGRFRNTWLLVHAADPGLALERLAPLEGLAGVHVLLALASAAGVLVQRSRGVEGAIEALRSLAAGPTAGSAASELAVLCAGLVLNELIFAGASGDGEPSTSVVVGYYSRHRARRIDAPAEWELAELIAELADDGAGGPEGFAHRRFRLLGAGALGNWLGIALAQSGPATLEVLDEDTEIEPHNLNRQILYAEHVGQAKAPVLAAELGRLNPAGSYTGQVRSVEGAEDLEPLAGVDALLVAPDNDRARLVASDTAWARGVLCLVGGTGATGGQMSVHGARQACFRCTTGIDESVLGRREAGSGSCAEQNASVVASNMVVAGLMVSELREGLGGRATRNLRFIGAGRSGNRLVRMPSPAACRHRRWYGSRQRGD